MAAMPTVSAVRSANRGISASFNEHRLCAGAGCPSRAAFTTLFWWEFNVRASTVLGVVGAGGIGQELKNSMDLLDFARLFTIIAVILVVVTALDQLSGWLRKRLV
jgi:hypothetical protein